MAPLRSSRTTRNQDHLAAQRSRTGILDLDPTDGLPVTKWSQVPVRVNQDTDLAALNPASTGSADWSAQFNTAHFPWAEPPIPTYFKDIPSWNQEMIRRARAGATNTTLSAWDRKTHSWISAADAEKKGTSKESPKAHDHDHTETTNGQNGQRDSPKSEHDDHDSDSKSDDENTQEEETTAFKTPVHATKRRKTSGHLEPRVFEVKKWIQVPISVAEKTAEPKFLADRRPGMPPLYNAAYQNAIFGSYLSDNQVATATYDLGDGGGLGNAAGMLGTGQNTEAAPTPVRRNMPPKRKKKKIGGPGRKKANASANTEGNPSNVQDSQQAGNVDGSALVVQQSTAAGSDGAVATGDTTVGDNEGEEESGTESDGEGSEEGEIEEGEQNEVEVGGLAKEDKMEDVHSIPAVPEITTSTPQNEPTAPVVAEITVDEVQPAEPLPEAVTEIEQVSMPPPAATEDVLPPVTEPINISEPVPVSAEIEAVTEPETPAIVEEPAIPPALPPDLDVSVATSIDEQASIPVPEQAPAQDKQVEHQVLNPDLLSSLDASIDDTMDEK